MYTAKEGMYLFGLRERNDFCKDQQYDIIEISKIRSTGTD